MTLSKFFDLFSSPCRVTPQQAEALDQLSNTLNAFCEEKAEITTAVVGAGLAALGQIASSAGEEEGAVSWRAIRMKSAPQTGASLIVRNSSGDELSLQLDVTGQAYIGTYSNFMGEDDFAHVLAFDLKSTSTGKVFRLLDEENVTELLLVDNDNAGMAWTGQPDFGMDLEVDALTDESYNEIAAAFDEETDETETLAVEAMKGESNEFDDEPQEAQETLETLPVISEEAHLDCVSGPNAGHSIPLKQNLVIGRSENANLQLDDEQASRQHAELYPVAGDWWLKDLGSRNGTFVNDTLAQEPLRLSFGDKIRLGASTFILRAGE